MKKLLSLISLSGLLLVACDSEEPIKTDSATEDTEQIEEVTTDSEVTEEMLGH